MKRRGLVLVIAMLAIASLMAAMAFSYANVPNNVTSAVVNTNEALLSIVENPNFTDFASIGADGKLYIDFTNAYSGSNSGFQPGSTYEFKDLFYIKNNITKDIKVGIRFDQCYPGNTTNFPKGLHKITTSKDVINGDSFYKTALIHVNGGVMNICGNYQNVGAGAYVTLAPGEQIGLTWSFVGVGSLENEKQTILQVVAQVDR
ncbi:MAG TPA: DUF1102 domain-containing protein [Peptococcaceae bacterium]|nr:DUF1102 domain-containing protein [Peptococcaceae bacterium]